MPNWCTNRLYITGPSQQVTEVKKLMKGEIYPLYREAINKSIKFFIAGCARIVKPIDAIEASNILLFNNSNTLIPYMYGEANNSNQAFSEWLTLLKLDPSLTKEVSEKIIALYKQSGLAEFSLDSISAEQFEIINQLFDKQSYDWFGSLQYDPKDIGTYWHLLDEQPMDTSKFDMRLVLAPKLIPEIVGFNAHLFNSIASTLSSYTSYINLYGVKWPVGCDLHLEEYVPKTIIDEAATPSEANAMVNNPSAIERLESITVNFETPWSPPSMGVLIALSEQYQCFVEHYYAECGVGYCGYASYDCGIVIEETSDDLVYGEEDEDGFCDVIGPSYIIANVPRIS